MHALQGGSLEIINKTNNNTNKHNITIKQIANKNTY